MELSNDVLEEALERSMFLIPELPGRLRHLTVPRVKGHISLFSHPHANMVGMSTLSESDADEGIERVRKIYAAENKGFSWVVGPITTPVDMGDRLVAVGFVKTCDMAGMVLTDLQVPIRRHSAVRVRLADGDDLKKASATIARGFGLPEELAHSAMEARLEGSGHPRSDVYLAFVDQGDTPAGCATLDYVPGQPIVRLGGAATLEEHRGRGVYTSLVARRLSDASEEGMLAAVIQSARASSEPICRRLGFREICDMAIYSWTAPDQSEELRKLAGEWTV